MTNQFNEIFKLDEMLTRAGIPHTRKFFSIEPQKPIGYQIRMYADKECTLEIDDCVCHHFSHGFSLGLLETYELGECNGFETAEEVFSGWLTLYRWATK